MGQSARAILIVVLVGCGIAAVVAWGAPELPATVVWALRLVLPVAVVAGVLLLIRSVRRADLAPDFLSGAGIPFFERDGFCFTIVPVAIEGVCYFEVWYQNRYERACQARVVISRGVSRISAIPVECDGGAYGVVRAPYGVHANYQGTVRQFEVSAAARYPEGKGQLLRFRDGMSVGRVKMQNWSGAGAMLTLGLAGVGVIAFSSPAKVMLQLPEGVAEEVPEDAPLFAETHWRLGDPTTEAAPTLS